MNHPIREEQLDAWLREAADALPAALMTPDAVTAGVYRKLHRRTILRTAGASLVIATLLLMVGIPILYLKLAASSSGSHPPCVAFTPPDVEQLRARLAALEKEIAAQKARLELLAETQRPPQILSAKALLPPEDLAQIEWEQIAAMVLARAERLAETKRKQEAAAEYRRIIDDFPATSLLDTAKKQLQQLTSN